jgi:hypothetical protein
MKTRLSGRHLVAPRAVERTEKHLIAEALLPVTELHALVSLSVIRDRMAVVLLCLEPPGQNLTWFCRVRDDQLGLHFR